MYHKETQTMKKLALLPIFFFISIALFSQASFDIDKKPIKNQLLSLLCDHELKWFRNEIYARHGYVFSNKEFQSYFQSMEWYTPVSDNSQVRLSKVEQDNITILKNEEQRREKRTKAIRDFFNHMKASKNYLVYQPEDDCCEISVGEETLDKIDLDNMSFCGANGLYQVTIDEGFSVISYFLRVDGDKIRLGTNCEGKSSIVPDKARGEYEDESNNHIRTCNSAIWYEFIIDENNNIEFSKIDGAG